MRRTEEVRFVVHLVVGYPLHNPHAVFME